MTHHNNLPPGVTKRDCEPRNPCDEHDADETCDFCQDVTECIYCHAEIPFGCVECDECEDEE